MVIDHYVPKRESVSQGRTLSLSKSPCLDEGSVNQVSLFLNKAFLEHSPDHSLIYCLQVPARGRAEWTQHGFHASEAKSIYVALNRSRG